MARAPCEPFCLDEVTEYLVNEVLDDPIDGDHERNVDHFAGG